MQLFKIDLYKLLGHLIINQIYFLTLQKQQLIKFLQSSE